MQCAVWLSVFVCIEAENVFKSMFSRNFFIYVIQHDFYKHISGSDLNLLVADQYKPNLSVFSPIIYWCCYFAVKKLSSDSDEQIVFFLMFIHYIIYKHFLDSDLNLLEDDPNLYSDAFICWIKYISFKMCSFIWKTKYVFCILQQEYCSIFIACQSLACQGNLFGTENKCSFCQYLNH